MPRLSRVTTQWRHNDRGDEGDKGDEGNVSDESDENAKVVEGVNTVLGVT
jgi:hypothetical protein